MIHWLESSAIQTANYCASFPISILELLPYGHGMSSTASEHLTQYCVTIDGSKNIATILHYLRKKLFSL